MLNNFFASVFTEENTEEIPILAERVFEQVLEDVVITQGKVEEKLCKLKSDKSPGIDMIHPMLLKECNKEISETLTGMFNSSLTQGTLPDVWKKAQVVPIFKKGSKHQCCNYRPVSLIVVLCKVLESFIKDAVMSHMENNDLCTVHQHGFRSKRSCVTQLLEVFEEWSDILERGGNLDCIYLDFAKAFDTVPYKRLLNKLHSYGIRGQVLQWIKIFLENRKQQVKVGSSLSRWVDVKSGIPQGSVLGPTLFLIYINDLPEVVANTVKLFADDTKVYRVIDNTLDTNSLQEDLHSLSEWSDTWQLRFNAEKCKCMHLGKSNTQFQYCMQEKNRICQIENVTQEKDLGVVFDNELSFNEHIAQKIKKANQALGMIKNTFSILDKDIFLPLYKSFVRPHLEYASVVWSPAFKKDIISIENVQRRATKLVTGLKDKSYEDRLKFLGLPTLHYRRDRSDMIQLFKIMKSFDEVSIKNIKPTYCEQTRGHMYKLQKNQDRSRFGQNRFSSRTVNMWNSLRDSTVNASSVNSFKTQLNDNWRGKQNKFSPT